MRATVEAAGVDTWSLAWYVEEGGPSYRALDALAVSPAPRSKLIREKIGGHRVGWFKDARLVFAEGPPSSDGLCAPGSLPAAFEALMEAMADYGVLTPRERASAYAGLGSDRPTDGNGFAGIRRLDSTLDLRFDRAGDGLGTLAGVAALPLARMKTQAMREVGGRRIETVSFFGSSGKRLLGRWYDKGVESGSDARGLRIRPEDQRRFAKLSRPPLDAVANGGYVRQAFVRRFEPLWKASKGIRVGGLTELAEKIADLRDEGEITGPQAERLAGYLLLDAAETDSGISRATKMRRRAACRDLGLVLADGVLQEGDVDLHEVLEAALDGEVWGRG